VNISTRNAGQIRQGILLARSAIGELESQLGGLMPMGRVIALELGYTVGLHEPAGFFSTGLVFSSYWRTAISLSRLALSDFPDDWFLGLKAAGDQHGRG